jgi:hypothetical protein
MSVDYLQLLCRYLLGGTEEDHTQICQNCQSPDRDSKPGFPDYGRVVVTIL